MSDNLAADAVAAAGDAIITVNQTATITSWNAEAERLFGHPADAVIGQSMAIIVPEGYRARHVAGFHAALNSGKLAHGGQPTRVEGVTADGATIPLEMTLGLLQDDAGESGGVVAVLRQRATPPVSFIG